MAAATHVIIAVLGKGDISALTVKALIADRTTGQQARFVFPLTDETWSPAVQAAANWALKRDRPYELVLDGSEADIEAVDELLEGAASTHKVAAVETKLVALLADAQGPDCEAALLLSWDDDDDACQRALAKALKRGVKAYDLRDGLNDLTFDDTPAPAPEPEPEPQPETDEAKPKRTRRTKAQMEAARAAEAEAAEGSKGMPDSAYDKLTPVAEAQPDEAQGFVQTSWSINTNNTSNGNGHLAVLGVSIDTLLDQLAEKVAAKVNAR